MAGLPINFPEAENGGSESGYSVFVSKNFLSLFILLFGFVLLGLGFFLVRSGIINSNEEIEILEASDSSVPTGTEIVVELAGAVEKPAVYKMPANSRISDLLIEGGGSSADADREWVVKYLNQAAVLSDGQKIYIPKLGESLDLDQDKQSNSTSANISSAGNGVQGSVSGASTNNSGLININTASLSELDKLPGIGPVYGQNIIEQRPYSSVEELLTKKVLRKDVYEKIKEKVGVY